VRDNGADESYPLGARAFPPASPLSSERRGVCHRRRGVYTAFSPFFLSLFFLRACAFSLVSVRTVSPQPVSECHELWSNVIMQFREVGNIDA